MKRKLVAIGGGENGRLLENNIYAPYETEIIDKEIIRLTDKGKPNFLFVGHAMSFSKKIENSYYETMKRIYGDKFNCNCKILKSIDLNNKKKVQSLIDWSDIIYVSGGDTKLMIDLWKLHEFDKILYDAWNSGKVICGISAGAACWFKEFNSKLDNGFFCLSGLNWFEFHLTPHSNENGRRVATKKFLKNNKLKGIMLSNSCAIEIIDNQYQIICNSCDNIKEPFATISFWKNNKYIEKKLNNNELHFISELFDIESE